MCVVASFNRLSRRLLWLAVLMSFCASCVAPRFVAPRATLGQVNQPSGDDNGTWKLRDFMVSGASRHDNQRRRGRLRDAFANRVARAIGATDLNGDTQAGARLIDVKLDVRHSANRTYILDLLALYPFLTFSLITPQWGNASVTADVTVHSPNGDELFRFRERQDEPYSIVVYSWWRTKPIEMAFRHAYAKLFDRVAARIVTGGAANGPAVDESPPANATSQKTATATGGQQLPDGTRIAVMPTQFGDLAKDRIPTLFDEYLLTAVQNSGTYEVVGKDDIESMMGFEAQRELFGCDDVDCMANLSSALKADFIIATRIAMADDEWIVTTKLIDLEAARVVARANEIISGGVKELLKAVPLVVGQILNK